MSQQVYAVLTKSQGVPIFTDPLGMECPCIFFSLHLAEIRSIWRYIRHFVFEENALIDSQKIDLVICKKTRCDSVNDQGTAKSKIGFLHGKHNRPS